MKLTKYEKYEIVEIERKDIKNAPYNPRKISASAKAKLKENIKKVGLLQPTVWNVVTGNIVAGHQKLSIIDALEGRKNYRLRVSKVNLDAKTEKEQNIFMNNPEAQGEFDYEELDKLLAEGLDIESTGFDIGDIYQMFGNNPVLEEPENLVKLSEKLKKTQDNCSFNREGKAKVKERDDVGYYLVVVFKDYETRKEFTDKLALHDDRYQDGKNLLNLLTNIENSV